MAMIARAPLDDATRRAQRARREFADLKIRVIERIGLRLLNLAQLAYIEKSAGRTGSDGITWKPLKDETIKRKNRRARTAAGRASMQSAIGVDTGLQRASAQPAFVGPDGMGGNVFEIGTDEVTVGYGRVYSKYFDEARPLLPDGLPDEWLQELEPIIADWANVIMRKAFHGA